MRYILEISKLKPNYWVCTTHSILLSACLSKIILMIISNSQLSISAICLNINLMLNNVFSVK